MADYIAFNNGRPNIPGAAVFLSYIVAALVLTLRVVSSLRRSYLSYTPSSSRPTYRILLFSVLALMSFSLLSWHMLSFLILSYKTWARSHGTYKLPTSMSEMVYHPGRLELWRWMSHSSLFEDFARAITSNGPRWWWTQLALLETMQITLWICQDGSLQNLGGLMLLAQILPISFTLNLAFIGKLLRSPSSKTTAKAPTAKRRASPLPSSSAEYLQIGLLLAYLGGMYFIPTFAASSDSKSFISYVLVLRLLLCAPYFLQTSLMDSLPYRLVRAAAIALQAKQTIDIRDAGFTQQDLIPVLNEHPAVSALGYDAVVGLVSALVYSSLQVFA